MTTFALAGQATSDRLNFFAEQLREALSQAGFADDDARPDIVLNLIDPAQPEPFRRRSSGIFVAALHERDTLPDGFKETREVEYPLLVQALANIVLCLVPGKGVWFTTLEQGGCLVSSHDGLTLAEAVIERLAPLARARLVPMV